MPIKRDRKLSIMNFLLHIQITSVGYSRKTYRKRKRTHSCQNVRVKMKSDLVRIRKAS